MYFFSLSIPKYHISYHTKYIPLVPFNSYPFLLDTHAVVPLFPWLLTLVHAPPSPSPSQLVAQSLLPLLATSVHWFSCCQGWLHPGGLGCRVEANGCRHTWMNNKALHWPKNETYGRKNKQWNVTKIERKWITERRKDTKSQNVDSRYQNRPIYSSMQNSSSLKVKIYGLKVLMMK